MIATFCELARVKMSDIHSVCLRGGRIAVPPRSPAVSLSRHIYDLGRETVDVRLDRSLLPSFAISACHVCGPLAASLIFFPFGGLLRA